MHKTHRQMTQELGREPGDHELAAKLGVPSADVASWRVVSRQPTSLDEPTGEDGRFSLGDLLSNDSEATPCDKMIDEQLRHDVRELLNGLDERERTILVRRYGLDGAERQTLDTVGRKFKITRERVRQIQGTAVTKLRAMFDQREQPQSAMLANAS